jgi:CRP-like cAMP-binding protein
LRDEQLQQQLRQQAAEIAALKKRLDETAEFPQPEQQRFAATATAMGLSYGQARELLEIVVKKMSQPRDDWPMGEGVCGGRRACAEVLGSGVSRSGHHGLL